MRERLGILSEPNVKPLATATLFNVAGNNVSSSRLSAGLSEAGSRWSGMLSGSWGMARSLGGGTLVSGGSVGSRPPGFMWARASLRDKTAGVALRRIPVRERLLPCPILPSRSPQPLQAAIGAPKAPADRPPTSRLPEFEPGSSRL